MQTSDRGEQAGESNYFNFSLSLFYLILLRRQDGRKSKINFSLAFAFLFMFLVNDTFELLTICTI